MSFASLLSLYTVFTNSCISTLFYDLCVCIGKEVTEVPTQEVLSEGV